MDGKSRKFKKRNDARNDLIRCLNPVQFCASINVTFSIMHHRDKRDRQYFGHNFHKFKYVVVIFARNIVKG